MSRVFKLNQLMVHVLQADGNRLWLPVAQSPYLKTLDNADPTIFHDYNTIIKNTTSTENYEQEMSYEQFSQLHKTLAGGAFDFSLSPKIKLAQDNLVADGQHRLAILYHLYFHGASVEMEFNEEGELIGWAK